MGLLVFAALLTGPSFAQPQDKAACLASYTKAQRLRKDGALIESRGELRTCADRACPALIVKDCTKWLEEVQAEVPTVVVAARDGEGQDVVAAELLLDGEVVASSLDGKPIEVDPGPHTFRVRRGDVVAEATVVARAGDNNRLVELELGAPDDAAVAPPTTPREEEGPSALLISGGVLAGLGVVGLGVFAGLGIVGSSEADDLNDGCGATNTCTQEEIDDVDALLLGADISLAAGLVLAAAGTTLILVDVLKEDEVSAAVEVSVDARGRGVAGAATFRF